IDVSFCFSFFPRNQTANSGFARTVSFGSAPSTHFNLENESSLPTLTLSVFSNGDAVIARRSVADLDPALAHVRVDRVISSGGRINGDIRAAGITVALDG